MRKLLLVIFALALVLPVYAGHLKKVWEEKGQVDVVLFDDVDGHQKILFRGLPLTADRFAGPAVMVWDGIPVYQWSTPVYEFVVDVTGESLSAIKGNPEKGGQLLIPWMKSDGRQKINLRTLTLGTHSVSIYFATVDDRGRLDRSRTAAPATQFRLEDTDPPPAANTAKGEVLTSTQLEAAIKQSYEQGASEGKAVAAQEREQLLAELKKATDELNELRRQVALKTQSKSMPLGQRYLPIKCSLGQEDWPKLGDEMELVDSAGRSVAKAKVVETVYGIGRYWITVTVPVDFDPTGHTVRRPNGRKEDK